MQRSLVYGDQVNFKYQMIACPSTLNNQVTQLLNGSPIWKDYEQQKHDLFLDNEKPLALTQVNHQSWDFLSLTFLLFRAPLLDT